MKSYLLIASALLAEKTSVLGLTPLNTPIRTTAQSPTQLQYITDSNVDLEAMTANTTLASIWKSVVAVPPQAPAPAVEEPTPKRTPTTLAATLSDIAQTLPLSQLQPGDRLSGVVVRLLPYGALVQTAYDIPGKTKGCVLLHNQRLPANAPPLRLGQEIQSARVITMNRAKGMVSVSLLTQKQEQRMPLGALQAGDEVQGKVTKIHHYGAFVDVGTKRDALLHKSRMSPDFVASIYDHVQPGQRLRVRVIPSTDGTLAVTLLTPAQEAAVRERSQQAAAAASEEYQSKLLRDIDEALRLSMA